ncbi:unnamed protein product [Pieris macdunnoughi]|uniref:NADP-dependent oxidoreductase domain-containing protein n=1 Tax=Pieris macdunnoughi TaxID=345717 RepID=A0A821W1L4_9NEOP|nr:unnamed protein product [Pieris macdunnoughi]
MARQSSVYIGNHASIPSSVTPGLCYKNLGKSGLRVPNIGLSLWTMLNEDVAEDLVMTALENGINLIDLSKAHNTQGEAELGRILKKRNVNRSSIIITTKIYWSTKCEERGLSRKHITESVKESLGRLQLEYIDLVLLHKTDPVCPMEELVRTMDCLINQGFVMYWGTARWTPTEIMDAYSKCRIFNCCPPVVEQTEYHMFCREKTELYMPEVYHKIGVGTMVWSALTTDESRFNRKYSTFSSWEEELVASNELENNESTVAEESRSFKGKLKALSDLANAMNCSIRQLSVAWCLKNENITCLLLGATSVEQFKENIHALQIVPQLSKAVILDIEKILANKLDTADGTEMPKEDDVEANVSTPEKEEVVRGCAVQWCWWKRNSDAASKTSKSKVRANNQHLEAARVRKARSGSLHRSTSGQLASSRDRKISRFNLGSPADV